MDQRHRGLVRDAPETEGATAVADAPGVRVAVEAVEGPFRPRQLDARQPADGAVAVFREMAHQGRPVGGEQQLVIGRVAHVQARQQAGMGEPGGAAEGGRHQPRGDHLPAAGGDRGGEPRAVAVQGAGDLGAVEGHGAVGLGEHDQHVRAAQPGERAGEGRSRAESFGAGGARQGGRQQPVLFDHHGAHGRCEELRRRSAADGLRQPRHQGDAREGQHQSAPGPSFRAAGEHVDTAAHDQVHDAEHENAAGQHQQHPGRGAGAAAHAEYGAQMGHIPVEIDSAPEHGGHGDVDVMQHHPQRSDDREHGLQPARHPPAHQRPGRDQGHRGCELGREAPFHRGPQRRPGIAVGEQDVQHAQRERDAGQRVEPRARRGAHAASAARRRALRRRQAMIAGVDSLPWKPHA